MSSMLDAELCRMTTPVLLALLKSMKE